MGRIAESFKRLSGPVKYHAFLSYSHRADGALAPGLQRAIQRLSRPWYSPRPSLRIFRDGTDLPVSTALERVVFDALAQCEWLILMANPISAKSEWVVKEMGWWLQNRSAERVLIVKTGGTILWDAARQDFDWAASNALPLCLRGHLQTEPLYAAYATLRESAWRSLALALINMKEFIYLR